MRRPWRRVLIAAGAVVVLAPAIGLVYARPLLLTGTGYAAHNACAVAFVAVRPPASAADDLPDNPLVPYLRTSVSTERSSATTSILGVLFRQTARYQPGRGCTLRNGTPAGSSVASSGTTGTPPSAALPLAPTTDPQVTAAVDAAFGAGLGTRAVVVVHRGTIVAERYADGFTPQTRQLGWSMAKSVTNLLVGRLVQEGRLRTDEDHLRAEWTDERASITVDDMLRMATGLQWDETYDLGTPITEMLYLRDDMGGYAAGLPAVHPHGTYQQYSSGTTNALCGVLHDRTGLGPELADRLLFEPLGLSGGPTSPVFEPDGVGHLVCSSYLWATPRDWAAIGQFALDQGRVDGRQLLPAGWMTYSTTNAGPNGPIAGEEDGYGAHWWVNRRADGTLVSAELPPDAYWASGHDGQQVTIVPSEQLVVVRLGFTPDDIDTGVDRLVAELTRRL